MKRTFRAGLVTAGALLLAGVVSTGASAAEPTATISTGGIVRPVAAAAEGNGEPVCVVGDLGDLPTDLPVLDATEMAGPDGAGVFVAGGTVSGSDGTLEGEPQVVSVSADSATGIVSVDGGEVPQELIDMINADTDAIVAALHDAGFDVEVTTDEQGVRTPVLDPTNEAEMAAMNDVLESRGVEIASGVAVAVGDAGVLEGDVVSCSAEATPAP